MAKQLGRKMLLKYLSSAEGANPKVYTTIAALNAKSVTINNTAIDVTTGDDDELWMTTLNGVKSMSISADGIFSDNAAENKVEEIALAGAKLDFQLLIPDYVTYTGTFFIESFEYGGDIGGGVTFSFTLTSDGEIVRATV